MTIMSDKTLPIVVAALAGSLIGVLLGLWLGARGEQSASCLGSQAKPF
jgi:hypothetical protein